MNLAERAIYTMKRQEEERQSGASEAAYALSIILAAAEARAEQLERSSTWLSRQYSINTAKEQADAARAIRNALVIYQKETKRA
jgi:hypothetical protein